MKRVVIENKTHPFRLPLQAGWCDSFLDNLRGLMFRSSLDRQDGLWMVQPAEDRINSAIHMLFMNFDIAVVWLDSKMRVVDTRLAKKWRLAYFPTHAAKYVLEIHSDRLPDFQINDQITTYPCEK